MAPTRGAAKEGHSWTGLKIIQKPADKRGPLDPGALGLEGSPCVHLC